jgi:hypothetical protein
VVTVTIELDLLKEMLADLEYWYKRGRPEWDGVAYPDSTVGRARALVEASNEAEGSEW